MPSQAKLIQLAMVLGGLYLAYKYVPSPIAKAAIAGVGGVVIARQVPVLQDNV